ncbi:hypothetical protein C8R45DRAFT_501614 [Mycena sanguinolenta]|nr:hypothetical protein C8R45DRAFT_501614 [Mycena sanguinolenta]
MDSQDCPVGKYVGAFFPGAQNLVIMEGTFISVTNITVTPVPLDDIEFSSPTDPAKYAGAFFPLAQGLVVSGGVFISVTNIFREPLGFGRDRAHPPSSPVEDPDLNIQDDDEFALGSESQLPEYAGAFFPRAQALVVGGGTFVSITNVIHDPPPFAYYSAEFLTFSLGGLITELNLYETVDSFPQNIQTMSIVKYENLNALLDLYEETEEDISTQSYLQSLLAVMINCVQSFGRLADLRSDCSIQESFIQTKQFMQCYQTAVLTGYLDTDCVGELEITGNLMHPEPTYPNCLDSRLELTTGSRLTITHPRLEGHQSELSPIARGISAYFSPPKVSEIKAAVVSKIPVLTLTDYGETCTARAYRVREFFRSDILTAGFDKLQAIRVLPRLDYSVK